jgi:hypothetical protein
MEPGMEQGDIVSFEEIIGAARREEWALVNNYINGSIINNEQINWVLDIGIFDENQNIRNLAATLLDKSDIPLDLVDVENLENVMASDPSNIVRYKIAIALYKRGNKNSSAVEQTMTEARNDPDVGELANYYISLRK